RGEPAGERRVRRGPPPCATRASGRPGRRGERAPPHRSTGPSGRWPWRGRAGDGTSDYHGEGGLVEAELKPGSNGADEDQDKQQVAVGEGQENEPEPGHHGAEHHDRPQIEPIDEVARQRSSQGGLELGEREGQRGRGPRKVKLGE